MFLLKNLKSTPRRLGVDFYIKKDKMIRADVAEQEDALALGASGSNPMRVQISPSAPKTASKRLSIICDDRRL